MEKVSVVLCSVILIAYFIFTSGVVYEYSGSNITNSFEVPYSLGLSAERTGLAGVFNEDDIKCAKWLAQNWDNITSIVADYNGMRLLYSYSSKYDDNFHNLQNPKLPDKCYIFYSTWNTEHGKYVFGSGVGLRKIIELPKCDCPCECVIVFQSGNSTIYRKD